MMTPGVMNKMRHDFALLLNGMDGCNCLLTWETPGVGAIIDPVYGEISGAVVTGSQMVRCHVNKVFGEGEIKKKNLVDVMSGDAIMLFPVNIQGPLPAPGAVGQSTVTPLNFQGLGNLLFSVQDNSGANMGTWKMVEQPPNVFESYARLLVSGEQFVQAAYMRRYSTT